MTLNKKRVYLDCNAQVNQFKDLHHLCHFILTPYDDISARRNDVDWELGVLSKVNWGDSKWSWIEDNMTWQDHSGSDYLKQIYQIIDSNNRRDGLHLDSAIKSNVDLFLTADKGDIWKHRANLEKLLGFRIFHPLSELEALRAFILE